MPLTLREPVTITVRGEIYMDKREFAAINEERTQAGEELFKNPRNTAGGSIKLLDPRECARRPLRAICTRWSTASATPAALASLAVAARARAPDVAPTSRSATTLRRAARGSVHAWADRSDALPYEVDGLVDQGRRVRAAAALGDDREVPALGDRLQVPRRARPRRVCCGIEINVGRTGAVTPVAMLDPVELSGTTV